MKTVFLILLTSLIVTGAPPIDQTQKLFAADGAAGNYFGASVSISGDTAVIGATGAAVGQSTFQGVAYVYRRTNGVWAFHQRLVWEDGYSGAEFGTSVVIRGDTIMVGVPKATVFGNSWQGRVIVFRRIGSSYFQSQVLTASDGASGDMFGQFLSISGDTAMIGSFRDDVGANADQGSVYVFVRGQNGLFVERQKLTAPDGTASDNFGTVTVSGETAVVGAFQADVGSNMNQGAAYVFTKSGELWAFTQKLTASDGITSDWFGSTAKVYGGTIVVSAQGADVNSTFNNQELHIFSQKVTASGSNGKRSRSRTTCRRAASWSRLSTGIR